MKKVTTAVLALAALAMASPTLAATFWNEPFAYANGDLTSVSGGLWVNHSGTGTFIPVAGGAALLEHGSGSREDVNRTFAPRSATDKTYACFKVSATSTVPVTDVYFAHLKDNGTFNFAARTFMTGSGASYTLGLSVSSSTIGATWGSALTFGQVYTVVIMYDAAAGTAQLWVNPASEASTSISAGGGTAGLNIESFAMRQAAGNSSQVMDDIAVGETFQDVCPSATPTTETSWGRVKALYR
jgi:hypothetical protein